MNFPGNRGPAFKKPPQNSRADILIGLVLRGEYPGVKTPMTLDEVDVLDGGEGALGFTSFAMAVSSWKSRKMSSFKLPERNVHRWKPQ
jgi:hypothetical protein